MQYRIFSSLGSENIYTKYIPYCTMHLAILLTFMNTAPSIVPVEPKLQHDPHTAWSFTGVTAPIQIII